MKRILKIVLISLLSLIVILFATVHVLYHTFSPGDRGVPVDEGNLVYFQDSYDECRDAFLEKAAQVADKTDSSQIYSIRVPGETDNDLYIDLVYFPQTGNPRKLLILSSGVHGVEGFAGSAVQQMFLDVFVSQELLSEMGVLFIHAVNPYGFKYLRRVTEHNVDLNRGSGVDPALFKTANPGYGALMDMINPEGEVSVRSARNQFFYMIAISKMLKESMSTLRQAVLQGQYEYPDGLYYGGQKFEPQIDSLRKILPLYLDQYETILEIDLHTGYGARRVLHLFPNPVEDPDLRAKTEAVFEGEYIDWGDSDDFYTINGGFADSFLSQLNPDATYLYMAYEWGTFDTQKTFGSLKSLQKMINENQGFHYGYKNEKHHNRIQTVMVEQYYPDSDAWKSETLESGREMMQLVLKNYPAIH